MKNLLLILAIATSFSTATFASNIGAGDLAVIKTEKVEITLTNKGQKEFIISTKFEEDRNQIAMEFQANVSLIQVFDENGDVEMILPIGSENVNLGMSLFDEGEYQVGFMVDGYDEIQLTKLLIK